MQIRIKFLHWSLSLFPYANICAFTVAGDANFNMPSTNLTLAGFTQPPVARSVIESAGNFEKGLPQRFIWMFPKGTYSYLNKLQPINVTFTTALGK